MIKTKIIEDFNEWEDFVCSAKYALFVQSRRYGEFYKAIGESYWIVGVYDEKELVGGAMALSTRAKRGHFLYIPYGPIIKHGQENNIGIILNEIILFLTKLAKNEKFNFIRVSPFWDSTNDNMSIMREIGFRDAPMHALAETTWILPLNQEEKELISAMNKNHRNLIHRCEKDGVKVTFSNGKDAVGRFNDLHDITAKRHKFHRFSRNYIEKEFEAFAVDGMALVGESYLPDGTLDASAIIIFYGNMACYRHGASLGYDKRTPTSYLLQWRIIMEAKRRNMQFYNFWGIAPENAKRSHPFYGITHFKKGFGGIQKNLIHCQDKAVSFWYLQTWIVENLRRIKRGF